MKKTIIITGMAAFFAVAGMAGAQNTGEQSNQPVTSGKSGDDQHGQKMITHKHGSRDTEIIRQHDKMTAEYVSVHKLMISENPGMQDLNNTGTLSDKMELQHTSMLLQLDYMHELMAVMGIRYNHDVGQLPRTDLREMQKITGMTTGNNPVLLGLPGTPECS